MDTSTTALVAAREAAGDTNGSRALLRRAVLFGLLFSVLAALAGILAFQIIGRSLGQRPDLVRSVSLMLLALPGIVALPDQQRRLARHEDHAARSLLERLHRDIRHDRVFSRRGRDRVARPRAGRRGVIRNRSRRANGVHPRARTVR